MHTIDWLKLVFRSVGSQPLRSTLTASGIAIGIAAVVLLTAIGAGIQGYVLSEFTQFGTNLITIKPGKSSTFGASPGIFGSTRPLSLDDATSLARLAQIQAVVPVLQGNARIEAGARSRRTEILGVGPSALEVWRMELGRGHFLPDDDPRAPRPFVVLGANIRSQLFPSGGALGKFVRIGEFRYRVIGVMAPKGQILGFDIDNAVYLPATRALEIFNRDGLMEIDLLFAPGASVQRIVGDVKRHLKERHGREDFTVITQMEMLDVLNNILQVLTLSVGALGGISLFVGAVGILTIMTIAVSERTPEVGLLRAIGTERRQILALFLGEAMVLGALGGVVGLVLGAGLAALLKAFVGALPIKISTYYVAFSLGLSVLVGLVAGVLPARRAASLDPVEALRGE